MKKLIILVIATVATLITLAPMAANAQPPSESATPAVANSSRLTVEQLQNATYSGIYDKPVTLVNGKYEGEPFAEGASSRPTVEYINHSELYGDLNGDGLEDAVVFLVENSGGTGEFVYVAAQLNQKGQPVDAGTASVEDRVQIKSAVIENGQIKLETTTEGPGDAACCKSHKIHKIYAVQNGKLAEITGSAETPVKISAADLDGTTWTLVELGEGQPVLAGTTVTLSFAGNQLNGSGGCNKYNGSFSLAEENPFGMTVAPLISTQMACPEPILNQETAYLKALQTVKQWSYLVGKLVLYYDKGQGEYSRLLLAPATVSAAAPAPGERITSVAELTAVPVQWRSFTDPTQQFDIANPQNYTIAFNPDGTVNIKADCNNARGTYTADDSGSLTIEIGPMTKAMCPPNSRSDEFVQKLGFVRNFFMENGFVYLDMMADGGTLKLAPAPESAAPAKGGFSDAWKSVKCDTFDIPETVAKMSDCGYVTVPEFHKQPGGPTIQLAVVRTRSTGDNPAPDPLFMEQGGPGGSTLDIYPAVAIGALPNMQTLLKTRDLVFVEQRGTRHSKPSLLCPEQTVANVATLRGLQDKKDVTFLQECHARLQAEKINFDAFNTVENAADMYAVAEALGYDQFNYYGVSYGTLLGQYVIAQAKEHPVKLRSAIIDAVVAPDVDFNGKSGDTASYALRNVFTGCAQDEVCNRDFPNLESVFLGLVDQLNRQPITVTVTVPEDVRAAVPNAPVTIDATVTGEEFADVAFQYLYAKDKGRILPRHIYAAAKNNDFGWVAQGLADGLKANTATGMYFTMLCSRQNSVTNAGEFFGAPFAQLKYKDNDSDFFQGCRIFKVNPEGDAFTFADNSTPTLILNGANDPITPQPYGEYVGSKLQTAYVYTFPGMGHGTILDSPCAASIAVSFLANPTQGPDSSCLSSLKPVFYGFPTPLEQLTLVEQTLPNSITLVLPSQWTLGSMGLYTDPNDPASFTTGGVLVAAVAGKSPAQTITSLGSKFKEIARDQRIGSHSWTVLEETRPGLVITHVAVAADEAAGGTVLVQLSAAPATAKDVFAALWKPILSSVKVSAAKK